MRLMFVCAHPDDAEIVAGGTIAKHVRRGDAVTLVILTKGELGLGADTRDTLAEARKQEATAAAAVLGCTVRFMDLADTAVVCSRAQALELATLIRELRPDILCSHSLLDINPDHRAAALLASDARHFARLVKINLEAEPHNVTARFSLQPVIRELQGTALFEPDVLVDISDVFEVKMKALRQHKTQIEVNPEHVELAEIRARHFGQQCAVKYAEAFRSELRPAWASLPVGPHFR